jgi:cell division septation protein DedD
MMSSKFIAILAIFLLLSVGCSKDNDQVSELEQEVLNDQGEDYLAEDETMAEDTMPEAEPEEYAMTPETAPEEETTEDYDIPEPPPGEGYTVQVAAGHNFDYARFMVDKFITRGYEAYLQDADVEGETYYRIRIGNYATVTEARTVGEDIQDKYSLDYWIDNK